MQHKPDCVFAIKSGISLRVKKFLSMKRVKVFIFGFMLKINIFVGKVNIRYQPHKVKRDARACE